MPLSVNGVDCMAVEMPLSVNGVDCMAVEIPSSVCILRIDGVHCRTVGCVKGLASVMNSSKERHFRIFGTEGCGQ